MSDNKLSLSMDISQAQSVVDRLEAELEEAKQRNLMLEQETQRETRFQEKCEGLEVKLKTSQRESVELRTILGNNNILVGGYAGKPFVQTECEGAKLTDDAATWKADAKHWKRRYEENVKAELLCAKDLAFSRETCDQLIKRVVDYEFSVKDRERLTGVIKNLNKCLKRQNAEISHLKLGITDEPIKAPGAPETPVVDVEHKTTLCLDRAAKLVTGDRAAAYGKPTVNHRRTALMWAAYLGLEPEELDARDVCNMNAQQKISRDRHCRKDDNLCDTAGYMQNAAWIGDPRKIGVTLSEDNKSEDEEDPGWNSAGIATLDSLDDDPDESEEEHDRNCDCDDCEEADPGRANYTNYNDPAELDDGPEETDP